MELFQQITAMHNRVREFVEQVYPTFKVTAVYGYSSTEYRCPLEQQDELDPARVEYVLFFVNVQFRVELLRLADGLLLNGEVFVQQDGTFFFDSPVLIR